MAAIIYRWLDSSLDFSSQGLTLPGVVHELAFCQRIIRFPSQATGPCGHVPKCVWERGHIWHAVSNERTANADPARGRKSHPAVWIGYLSKKSRDGDLSL